jgi:hypothetical protein
MYCQIRHTRVITNGDFLVIRNRMIYNHFKILPAMTVLMHSYRRDMAEVLLTDHVSKNFNESIHWQLVNPKIICKEYLH